MTAAELIDRLDGVKTRGSHKWSAKCPAHADKSPSLSVMDGEPGILLKCFAAPNRVICRPSSGVPPVSWNGLAGVRNPSPGFLRFSVSIRTTSSDAPTMRVKACWPPGQWLTP